MAATTAVLLLWSGIGARAQAPVSDFSQLPARVRVGDSIALTDSAGREHKGVLFDLSANALVLETGGKRVDFGADSLRTIRWRRPDTMRNGALIGFGVGAGLGALGMMSLCGEGGGCVPGVALGALLYGGLGAAIGVGFDALVPGKMILVYQPAGTPGARLSVSPVLTPHRRGVAATLRF
jgi:hypothetical protein